MVKFHQRTQRLAFLICHRRYGKTVACVAELIIRALYTKKKNAQYAYLAPYRQQAKLIAWQYLVEMTHGVATEVKVSELSVTLPNGAKIMMLGSDNVNSLRGMYLDGAVCDEFAQMRPDLLEAVLMPCLLDRKGWLVIIGTAYGKLNKFFQYYEQSKNDAKGWFHRDIKVHDSGVIPQDEVARIQNSISEAKFQQEFCNSFTAELVGTYYASIITDLEQKQQVSNDPITLHDPNLKTHVAFDIGRGDSTVAWFWQQRTDGLSVIDCYANNGEQAQHYLDHLDSLPYDYGNIWLPHDAKAMTFATKKSALEQFTEHYKNTSATSVHITPKLSVEDGIEATRQTLPHCHFNQDKCWTGVEALRVYRKKWDEINQCFSQKPLHDFACLTGDARVATPTGDTRIADLDVGDLVTIAGLTLPIDGHHTKCANTLILTFNDTEIQCTPEHKFFTTRGLLTADSLRYNDCVLTSEEARQWSQSKKGIREAFTESFKGRNTDFGKKEGSTSAKSGGDSDYCTDRRGNSAMGRSPRAIASSLKTEIGRILTLITGSAQLNEQTLRTSTLGYCSMENTTIRTAKSPITTTQPRTVKRLPYTEQSILRRMERRLTGLMFTTSTTTPKTTRLKTSTCYQEPTTWPTTEKNTGSPLQCAQDLKKPNSQQGSGTVHLRGLSGIVNMARRVGKTARNTLTNAFNAVHPTKRTSQLGQNTATPTARRLICVKDGGHRQVYDLTIAHHHAYVANGLVVSNSDYADGFRYLSIVANVRKKAPPSPHPSLLAGAPPSQMRADYNLDNLYDDQKASAGRGIIRQRI